MATSKNPSGHSSQSFKPGKNRLTEATRSTSCRNLHLVAVGFQPKRPRVPTSGRSFQVPCHQPKCHSSGCLSTFGQQKLEVQEATKVKKQNLLAVRTTWVTFFYQQIIAHNHSPKKHLQPYSNISPRQPSKSMRLMWHQIAMPWKVEI